MLQDPVKKFRYMKSSKSLIERGLFRKELEAFWKMHGVQYVWISEDATKITEKI